MIQISELKNKYAFDPNVNRVGESQNKLSIKILNKINLFVPNVWTMDISVQISVKYTSL